MIQLKDLDGNGVVCGLESFYCHLLKYYLWRSNNKYYFGSSLLDLKQDKDDIIYN